MQKETRLQEPGLLKPQIRQSSYRFSTLADESQIGLFDPRHGNRLALGFSRIIPVKNAVLAGQPGQKCTAVIHQGGKADTRRFFIENRQTQAFQLGFGLENGLLETCDFLAKVGGSGAGDRVSPVREAKERADAGGP